jgi:hypothetical protein
MKYSNVAKRSDKGDAVSTQTVVVDIQTERSN